MILINNSNAIQIHLFDDESLSPANNIKTHKNLADCRYDISINEIKLLLGLISLSLKDDSNTGFKTFKFSITGLASFLGFKYQNRCRDIRKAIENLKKAEVMLPDINVNSLKERPIIHWLARSQISESKDFVDLKLNTELEEYLVSSYMEPNYLTYQLAIIMQMKSAYSVKMYHILLKHFWIKDGKIIKNSFESTINELKEILMIPKEIYPLPANFRTRILDTAQKECEKYSDIVFTFEPLKQKKQIYGYKFNIFQNPNYKPIPFELEPISSRFTGAEKFNSIIKDATEKGYREVISKLNYHKVSKSGIAEIIELCSAEEILELIKTAEELKTNKKINTVPGFIRASCRDIAKSRVVLEQYELIFDEVKKEEKEQKAKEEIKEAQSQTAATKENEDYEKKVAAAKKYLKKIGEEEFKILIDEFLEFAPEILKHNFDSKKAKLPREKSYKNLVNFIVMYRDKHQYAKIGG